MGEVICFDLFLLILFSFQIFIHILFYSHLLCLSLELVVIYLDSFCSTGGLTRSDFSGSFARLRFVCSKIQGAGFHCKIFFKKSNS